MKATTKRATGGFEVKDAARGEAVAVFSRFNVIDHDGDVTMPGAIKDGTEVILSPWGHASIGSALPVGRGVIRTTGTDARVEAKFFLDTTAGREAFEVVRQLGALSEWSYGFDIAEHSFGEHEGRRVRFLKRLNVFEVSPVARGAGIGTRTVDAKHELRDIHARLMLRQTRDRLAAVELRSIRARWES
jgi:hypothetical protein